MARNGILLIQCPDQKGILASICQFLSNHNGNIVSLQEYADTYTNRFFARVEWQLNKFNIEEEDFLNRFHQEVGLHYQMKVEFYISTKPTRIALFVSKYSHCLEDILYRYSNGELNIELPLVISNHKDLQSIVQRYKIPFYHLPINKSNKREQENKQIELIKEYQCELIVLARYMQILSADFVNEFENKIINIHHSFLPAFTGAKPYHAAYKRGVKIVGATAHFVTSELDEGPIICQDVTKISHKNTINDIIIKGRDVEKQMLSRAVKLYSEHKVIPSGNRTIVFE